MHRRRVQRTNGRAASDKPHRHQNQKNAETGSNPLPPISGNTHLASTSNSTRASPSTTKSLSSVPLHSCNLMEDYELLKEAYPSADDDHVQYVLENANNDLARAAFFLGFIRIMMERFIFFEEMLERLNTDHENKASQIMISLVAKSRDALEAMRAASNLKRAAKYASRRGDPVLCHQLSQQAEEMQAEAKKLIPNGTQRILTKKNVKNDMSILDLHGGLSASEAVHALKEHLFQTEFIYKLMGPTTFKGEITARQKENFLHVTLVLHVITGSGKHSKGHQPVLAPDIKKFLVGKRYRFEESSSNHGAIDVYLELLLDKTD